jgi:hypothetical protein
MGSAMSALDRWAASEGPLPEGWEPWPERPRGSIAIRTGTPLFVFHGDDGWYHSREDRPGGSIGPLRSRLEAIEYAERLFCGCVLRPTDPTPDGSTL